MGSSRENHDHAEARGSGIPRAAASKLPTLLDDAVIGLLLLRSTSRGVEVVDANRTAADLLGTAPERWVAVPLAAYPALREAADLHRAVERVARRQVPRWRVEHEVDADRARTVEITLTPGGRPGEVLAQLVEQVAAPRPGDQVARDADATAAAVDATISRFVGSVSHEFRTPLTSILGSTELLLDGATGVLSEQQIALLRSIERNGHRLRSLVLDLLEMACSDAATRTPELREANIQDVVRRACLAVDSLRSIRQVELRMICDASPPLVLGDSVRLEHAVRNLLANAITAMPDGGSVTVRIETAEEDCVLEVTDTGPAIPHDELRSLFRRFFKTTQAQAAEAPGVGCGLAVAHSIVVDHGGTLTASSTPGLGSTFTMRLRRLPG